MIEPMDVIIRLHEEIERLRLARHEMSLTIQTLHDENERLRAHILHLETPSPLTPGTQRRLNVELRAALEAKP